MRLRILEPCGEDWDAMEPRPGGRFCRRCARTVHDLSSMLEADARELLRTRQCVRYRSDAEGRVRFRRVATVVVTATLANACGHRLIMGTMEPLVGDRERSEMDESAAELPTSPSSEPAPAVASEAAPPVEHICEPAKARRYR